MFHSLARWLCSLPAGALRMLEHALFHFLFGAKGISQFFDKVYEITQGLRNLNIYQYISTKVLLFEFWIIMASPGSLKGQMHGTLHGHI